MTLSTRPIYTQERTYVLKLHRDANPRQGNMVGRLVHSLSGREFEFSSSTELIERLTEAAATLEATASAAS